MSKRLRAVCISWHVGVLGLICESAESGLSCFYRQIPHFQMEQPHHHRQGAAPRYLLLLSLCGRNDKHLYVPRCHNHLTAQEKRGKIREIGPSSSWILSLTSRCVSSVSLCLFPYPASAGVFTLTSFTIIVSGFVHCSSTAVICGGFCGGSLYISHWPMNANKLE